MFLLSTTDDIGKIDEITANSLIISDYNRTKSGVDSVDQKCASYITQRIIRKRLLEIFFRLLDITGINSEIIFNNSNSLEPPPRRRKCLTELGLSLMEDHLAYRAKIKTLPKNIF